MHYYCSYVSVLEKKLPTVPFSFSEAKQLHTSVCKYAEAIPPKLSRLNSCGCYGDGGGEWTREWGNEGAIVTGGKCVDGPKSNWQECDMTNCCCAHKTPEDMMDEQQHTKQPHTHTHTHEMVNKTCDIDSVWFEFWTEKLLNKTLPVTSKIIESKREKKRERDNINEKQVKVLFDSYPLALSGLSDNWYVQ